MPTNGRSFAFLAAALAAFATTAEAQRSAASLVIFDSRKPEPSAIEVREAAHNVTAYRANLVDKTKVDCETLTQIPPRDKNQEPAAYRLAHLIGMVRCATPSTRPGEEGPVHPKRLTEALIAALWIDYLVSTNTDETDLRAPSIKGDSIRIVVLQRATVYRRNSVPLLVRGQVPSLKIAEDGRDSRIGTDVVTLARLVFAIASASTTADPRMDVEKVTVASEPWVSVSDYVLKVERANLTIEARAEKPGTTVLASTMAAGEIPAFLAALRPRCKPKEPLEAVRENALDILYCRMRSGAPAAERIAAAEAMGELGTPDAVPDLREVLQATSDRGLRAAALRALGKSGARPVGTTLIPVSPKPAAPETDNAGMTAALVTGPSEHWYLSADVPMTSETRFTFDDKDELTPPTQVSMFYVGVDFLLGDLLSEKRNFLGNLVLKGMIRPSKRPLESYGLGVGLRGHYLKKYGVDFDLISPFVAVTSTRLDSEVVDAVSVEKGRRKAVRFGGSLNLDKAIGWISGAK